MQLRDARFGYAHHRADLLQVQLFFVVQAHEHFLAWRQRVDGIDHGLPEISIEQGPQGVAVLVHAMAVEKAVIAVRVMKVFVVQQLVAAAVAQHFLVIDERHFQQFCHFRLRRRVPQALLQDAHRLFDLAHVLAHAARQPVAGAQFVEHGAADTQHGIRLELRAMRLFIAADGVEQADHASLDQVIDLDRRRQFRLHMVRQTLHQRNVLRQQIVLVRFPFDRVHRLLIVLTAIVC